MGNIYDNFSTYRSPLISTTQLLRVNGIDGAKAYPTMPNSVVALFDANDDLMYIKSTDAANYPTIDTYSFTKIKPESVDSKNDYVTRKEFLEFKEELLNAKQSISKSISTSKLDLEP